MEYASLVKLYSTIESTPKRLEKTFLVANAFKAVPVEDFSRVVYLLQGTVFPPWSSQKVGVAQRLVMKAMQLSFGETIESIEDHWRRSGDLGDVAELIASKKKQATLCSQDLTVRKVFENIEKLSTLEGEGTVDRKVQLMAELLTSAAPFECRYIVRTLIGQLRAGLGEGTLRDALVWAFACQVPFNIEKGIIEFSEEARKAYDLVIDQVQHAIDLTGDPAEVGSLLKSKGLHQLMALTLVPGRPVKVMLFQKAAGIRDALDQVGSPAFVECKYDGFRIQIHKTGTKVSIFTRRLEDVTTQFPDIVSLIKESIQAESVILDAEAIGLDPITKAYLPFQQISQRIRRKYHIDEMAKKFPVEVRVFDVLFLNSVSLLNEPYHVRRSTMESIVPTIEWKLAPASMIFTSSIEEAQSFYESALSHGMEGVMAKNASSPYQPGSRVGFGVKVKPVMDTLDLVVVGAEWGEGKRAGWLTSFTLACRDGDGNFLEIGNVGTGFKEKQEEGTSFLEMTELLKPLIIEEKGREVMIIPQVVLEIKFEEIQQSPTYASGYALRFPRLVQIREDKPPQEASTLQEVQDLFRKQK